MDETTETDKNPAQNTENQEIDPVAAAYAKGAQDATRSLVEELINYETGRKAIQQAQEADRNWAMKFDPNAKFISQVGQLIQRNMKAIKEGTLAMDSKEGDPFKAVLNTHEKSPEYLADHAGEPVKKAA